MENRLRSSILSRSSEHIRTESLDSSLSGICSPPRPISLVPPGSHLAMKRSESDSGRRRSDLCEISSNSEQTQLHLLLRKMQVLEKKIRAMDLQLMNEQKQRLSFEAKVIKLEEENEKLKLTHVRAGSQLKDFADKFYAATEAVGSSVPSPNPSLHAEHSRTNSLSSDCSNQSRDLDQFSGISIL